MTNYPKFTQIKQKFTSNTVRDIKEKVQSELTNLELKTKIKPDDRVAVAVGSRGISDINTITKLVIEALINLDAKPFIIPAMGSHGGATAEGQRNVLAGYGITEESMGVPTNSSMEVTQIGETKEGIPVFIDKNAATANHVVVINRIKPHTRFTGRIESGLIKMVMVGLGKDEGAKIYHRAIMIYSFDQIVASVLPLIQSQLSILFGVAIIENGFGNIADIQAVLGKDFIHVEPKLKEYSLQMMPKLPFKSIDVLIIDEMGKDISGTGMDTNVIGRRGEMLDDDVTVARIFVRDLSSKSHGNACGIGLADFTTRRLVDKIKFRETYVNCITALRPEGAKIPMTFECDRDAIDAAISTCGVDEAKMAKIVWVKNTLDLERVIVSEVCLKEAEEIDSIERTSTAKDLIFDSANNLPNFEEWS